MSEITLVENGEEVGFVETTEPNAEYVGSLPIVDLMVEDVKEGIFTTTHDDETENDGETLPLDGSKEVVGDDLAEYVENFVAEISGISIKSSRKNGGGGTGNKNLQDVEDVDTTPPQGVQDAAQTALDWKEETGNPNDCGTQTGWTRASQLASGESLSEDTINRMVSFFARHDEGGSDQPREDCSRMMWKAWGGDPGKRWAESTQAEFENARENAQLSGITDEQIANSPEWDQPLLEIHQKVTDPQFDSSKELVGFTESATPEFVKDRIRDSILAGNIFNQFDTISSEDRMQLRENLLETLTSDKWTIDGVADQLEQLPGVDAQKAETIARTETASILNSAREDGYKEQGIADEDRFYWTGASPGDSRQTEACEWLIRKTNPFHGGDPVTLEELKELIDEAPEHDPDMQDNLARPDNFVVHPNERSSFARAPPE